MNDPSMSLAAVLVLTIVVLATVAIWIGIVFYVGRGTAGSRTRQDEEATGRAERYRGSSARTAADGGVGEPRATAGRAG